MRIPLLFLILLSSAKVYADSGYTFMHGLTERDNPDSIGLAGVSLVRMGNGISDSAAAIPLQPSALQIFARNETNSQITPKEENTTSHVGLNLSFQIPTPIMTAGAGLKIRNTPFRSRFEPNSLNALEYQNSLTEVRGAWSALIFDELSVGIEPIFVFGDEIVTQSNPWQKIEGLEFYGSTGRISAQINLRELRLAASWQKDLTPTVNRNPVPREGTELGSPYFPGEYRVGAGYSFPALFEGDYPLQFNLLSEADFVYFSEKRIPLVRAGSRVYQRGFALYVPFDETDSEKVQRLRSETITTPRIALEGTFVSNAWMKLNFGTGIYIEPALIAGVAEKSHYTAGVSLILWGFRFAASVDQHEKKPAYTLGVGAQYGK